MGDLDKPRLSLPLSKIYLSVCHGSIDAMGVYLSGIVFVLIPFRISLQFIGASLFSETLFLDCRKDSCCLALCIYKLIVKILVVFQEFADGERFVCQVYAELVAIRSQGVNVFHHCDSFHRSYSELVILFGKLFVLIFKFSDPVFKLGNLTKVRLYCLFNFGLELSGSSI